MSTALERGEHGTPTTWRQGCRCGLCRGAQADYARVRYAAARLAAGGEAASKVSPRRMLAHLEQLVAVGVTAHAVARRAGVAPSTLTRARRRGVKVSRIVERLVLAVEA